ncbi:peptidase S1 [Platysternon megacephalum]|uniref:Peptidase S1 n=1 Tax=Platysternon megacephalum TaxID=55544 RepID=A0A4D9DM38_9SAUR|nr:peptidase S1 [Platysternon megacephalum]
MIPGDGIGPELMLHVKEVFREPRRPVSLPSPRQACVPVDFEEVRVSSDAAEDDIQNAIMAIRRNRVALKGLSWCWGVPGPQPRPRGSPHNRPPAPH